VSWVGEDLEDPVLGQHISTRLINGNILLANSGSIYLQLTEAIPWHLRRPLGSAMSASLLHLTAAIVCSLYASTTWGSQ
jgi:hypothetical protein